MKKIVAAALLLVAGFSGAWAKDIPPSPRTYVHNEGILTEAGARDISQQLAQFEKTTGHQMVVAAFSSLDGEDVNDYTNRVFNTWKIGDKKRNDGVLFAFFKGDRKWRVEVGRGLEGTLPDLEASRIATEAAVPAFKRADFDAGTEAVIASLESRITDAKAGVPSVPKSTPAPVSNDDDVYWIVGGAVGIILIMFLAAAMASSGESDYSSYSSLDDEEGAEDDIEDDLSGLGTAAAGLAAGAILEEEITKPKHEHHHSSPSYDDSPSYTPPSPSYDPPSFGGGFDFGGDGGFSGGGGSSGGGGASGGW